jgi:Flp pilus assembly protein TadG
MKISTKRLNRHRQRGLAIVEFAVVLPILMFLLLATAELGRALYQQDALTKAVRDGARYLAANARFGTGALFDSAAFSAARNRVLCGSNSCGVDTLLPGMALGDVTAAAPDARNIEISAQYIYQPILGSVLRPIGFGSDIPLTFTLTATATMRIL